MGHGASSFGHWFLTGNMANLHAIGGILDGITGHEDQAKQDFQEYGHDFVNAWQGKGTWSPSADPLKQAAQAALQEKIMELGSGNKLNPSLWQDGLGATGHLTNQIRGVAGHPAMSGASASSIQAISNPQMKQAVASTRGMTRGLLAHSMKSVDADAINSGKGLGFPSSGAVNNSAGTQGPSTAMDAKQPQGGLAVS